MELLATQYFRNLQQPDLLQDVQVYFVGGKNAQHRCWTRFVAINVANQVAYFSFPVLPYRTNRIFVK